MKLSGRTPYIPLSAAIEWRLLSLTLSRDGRATKIGNDSYTHTTSRMWLPQVQVALTEGPRSYCYHRLYRTQLSVHSSRRLTVGYIDLTLTHWPPPPGPPHRPTVHSGAPRSNAAQLSHLRRPEGHRAAAYAKLVKT